MAAATEREAKHDAAAPESRSAAPYTPTVEETLRGIAAMLRTLGQDGSTDVALSWKSVDGRPGGLPLAMPPTVAADDDEEDDSPSDMEAAVLSVMNRMRAGQALTYQEIADKAVRANSGPLRKFVRDVVRVSLGRFVKRHGDILCTAQTPA